MQLVVQVICIPVVQPVLQMVVPLAALCKHSCSWLYTPQLVYNLRHECLHNAASCTVGLMNYANKLLNIHDVLAASEPGWLFSLGWAMAYWLGDVWAVRLHIVHWTGCTSDYMSLYTMLPFVKPVVQQVVLCKWSVMIENYCCGIAW